MELIKVELPCKPYGDNTISVIDSGKTYLVYVIQRDWETITDKYVGNKPPVMTLYLTTINKINIFPKGGSGSFKVITVGFLDHIDKELFDDLIKISYFTWSFLLKIMERVPSKKLIRLIIDNDKKGVRDLKIFTERQLNNLFTAYVLPKQKNILKKIINASL